MNNIYGKIASFLRKDRIMSQHDLTKMLSTFICVIDGDERDELKPFIDVAQMVLVSSTRLLGIC